MRKGKNTFLFNHNTLQKFWTRYWLTNKTYIFNPLSNKKPFYVLDMFLYPSGDGLHVGHPRGYTATDIIARMKKLQGYEVCHPIGWDAFGLPAEQYAIKHNLHPQKVITKNINTFRRQLQALGFSYDYSLEINTTDPKYYAETQRMFISIHKQKLAYRAKRKISWCEELQTALANEETYILGGKVVSKVGDFPVTQRYQSQWIVAITKLASELLTDMRQLDWPKSIIKQQEKWIGSRWVFQYDCNIYGTVASLLFEDNKKIQSGFAILIAPESPIISNLNVSSQVMAQIKNLISQSDFQRTRATTQLINLRVNFTFCNKEIPLYVMGGVQEIEVNNAWFVNTTSTMFRKEKVFLSDIPVIKIDLSQIWNFLKKIRMFHMRDWVFSRQRFWGEPFPIYYDSNGTLHYEKNLPLQLPLLSDCFAKVGREAMPLKQIRDWIEFERDNEKFTRDPNVMPQWAGSSWYYIAYLWKAAKNYYEEDISLKDPRTLKIINKFLPVDLYIGGKEHAVLHLIYSRFWHKILWNEKLVSCREPFQKLFCQGLILGENNLKMSKSRGNVINPDNIINEYGADALRCYEMFIGPLDKNFRWSTNSLIGIRKWLDRFAKMYQQSPEYSTNQVANFEKFYWQIIVGLNDDFESLRFNKAVSKFMILTNYCYKHDIFPRQYLKSILIMFSCICPFICEEIWLRVYNQHTSIYHATWPIITNNISPTATTRRVIIQQNHRFRFVINIAIDSYMPLVASKKTELLLTIIKKHPLYQQKAGEYKQQTPTLYECSNNDILNFKSHIIK